jgi:hypothetical protein
MRFAVVVSIGVASILLGAATAQAQGPPTCRVLLVKSAATEAVSKTVIQEVKTWVEDPERGSSLASTIDEADVVLEFNKFGLSEQFDGIPTWQWRFVARRLSEPNRERASYRFTLAAGLDRGSTAHFAKKLPTILTDVCMGWLPKVASAEKR